MTNYPGDDPQTPDDTDGTEPTQPVGYWERRAQEQAAEQSHAQGGQPNPGGQPYPTTPYPQGGPVFNPTSAQASPPAPAPQASPQSGQNPYGHGPYSQPAPASYGAQPPGFTPAPGQPSPYMPMPPFGGFVAPPPDHPQSTLALVLGLVGLIGALLLCGVTLVVSPFAWGIGHSALKGIRESQGRLGGEGSARTGMILGIIGTIFLVLGLIVFIAFVVLIAVSESSTTGSSV